MVYLYLCWISLWDYFHFQFKKEKKKEGKGSHRFLLLLPPLLAPSPCLPPSSMSVTQRHIVARSVVMEEVLGVPWDVSEVWIPLMTLPLVAVNYWDPLGNLTSTALFMDKWNSPWFLHRRIHTARHRGYLVVFRVLFALNNLQQLGDYIMNMLFLIKSYIGPATWPTCSPWNPHGWKGPGSIKYFARVKPGRQSSSEGPSPRQKSWDYSDCCDLSPLQGSAQLSPAGSPGPWWSCLSHVHSTPLISESPPDPMHASDCHATL